MSLCVLCNLCRCVEPCEEGRSRSPGEWQRLRVYINDRYHSFHVCPMCGAGRTPADLRSEYVEVVKGEEAKHG